MPPVFWLIFYVFVLLTTLPVLAYIGVISQGAPGSLTVTINQKSGTTDPNPSYTSIFEVVFSDPIDEATFTDPDITLAGTAPGQAIQSITESGSFDKTTYDIRIQATAAGTITPSIAAELISAADSPTNTNNASTSTDNSVTYDGTYAPNEFVTTWNTNREVWWDGTGETQLRIPSYSGGFNYDVDWNNDGVYDQTGITSSSVVHDFGSVGTYTIRIKGVFPRFYYANSNDSDSRKLVSVNQWGTNPWSTMDSAFFGAENFNITASDAPDLSSVSSMASMFKEAYYFNSNINHWDVSSVNNMSGLFGLYNSFNQPLSSWNVSNVSNMSSMFAGADYFNQPIGNWDVSNVTNMGGMFGNPSTFTGATAFNQPIGNWDVSNVTNMTNMFYRTTSFNQPLNDWDVSGITDMTRLFNRSAFNQSLNDWDVSNVTNMNMMFAGSSFNGSVNNWDVSNVTSMFGMFGGAANFNQALNNWNVSGVTNMEYMFGEYSAIFETSLGATAFDQPIGNWDVSSVTSMVGMFKKASNFDQPLDNWNVSAVSDMTEMFAEATAFNQPLNNWNVSGVTDMSGMFYKTETFNQPLNNWDVSNVTAMGPTVFGGLGMFERASAFNGDISTWDVSGVTTMKRMFYYATSFNQSLNNWNVGNVEYFNEMFANASDFNQPLNSWDITSATNMSNMLYYATSFNQSLGDWNIFATDPPGDNKLADMLSYSGINVVNLDATFSGWADQNLSFNNNQTVGVKALHWCKSEDDRLLLASRGMFFNVDGGAGIECLEVITLSASSIDGDSAILDLQLNSMGGDDEVTVGFDYGETISYGSNINVQQSYAPQSYNLSATNLTCSTTYHYRAYATNSIETVYGTDKTFTTDVCPSDLSMNVSLLNTGYVRQGDDVNYQFTIKNEGPNIVPRSALVYMVLPDEFTYQSINDSVSAVTYPGFPTNFENIGGWPTPMLDKYSGMQLLVVSLYVDGGYMQVGETDSFVIAGSANTDYTNGVTTMRSIAISDADEQYEIISQGFNPANYQDGFELPVNNVATHTYSYTEGSPTEPNQPPTVSLTAPENNYHFPSNTTEVDIAATASDSDGTISKVRFYLGSDYIGEDTTAPYEFTATNLSPGDYSVKAVAYDNTGTHTTSSPRVFTILAPGEPTPNPNPPPYTPPEPQTPAPPSEEDQAAFREQLAVLSGLQEPEDPDYPISPAVAKYIPWSILALLLAITGLLTYSTHMENNRRAAFERLNKRFKASLETRAIYLKLTSHYIKTPLTKLQSSLELLAATAAGGSSGSATTKALAAAAQTMTIPIDLIHATQGIVKQLTTHAENLLEEGQSLSGKQQANINVLKNRRPLSVLSSPWFWVPTASIGLLTVLANFLLIQADLYESSFINYAVQALLWLVLAVALAVTVYFRRQARTRKQIAQTQTDIEQEMQDRQHSFIDQAYQDLKTDLDELTLKQKDIAQYRGTQSFTQGLHELTTIVDQLGKVNQLSRYVPGLTYQTNLTQQLSAVITNLRDLADHNQVTITTHHKATLPPVNLPEAALRHLIAAPLKNAVQQSSRGQQVTITTTTHKDQVELTITDHGKGIPKDQLNNLFKPFTSVTDPEHFLDTGLGLDLYLAKVITDQYGGDISLTSTPEQGTTATVRVGKAPQKRMRGKSHNKAV